MHPKLSEKLQRLASDLTIAHGDKMRRIGPYAAAYGLGVFTFWAASAMLAEPYVDITPAYVDSGTGHSATSREASRDGGRIPPAARLHDAAQTGQFGKVRRLLADNVDVNASDERGRTALILAAAAGQNRIVSALIEGGADTEATSKDGETALMAAAAHGNDATVKLLLRRDAKVRAKNLDGATAHDLAIRHKHDSVARLIADEIDKKNRQKIMVTRAQFLLSKLGYKTGGIDGAMSAKTRESITKFQENQDLIVDGLVSPTLITALDERQKAMESSRAAKRAAKRSIVKQRHRNSVKALHKANARQRTERGKPRSTKRETPKKGSERPGFFSRASKWLKDNSDVPGADIDE